MRRCVSDRDVDAAGTGAADAADGVAESGARRGAAGAFAEACVGVSVGAGFSAAADETDALPASTDASAETSADAEGVFWWGVDIGPRGVGKARLSVTARTTLTPQRRKGCEQVDVECATHSVGGLTTNAQQKKRPDVKISPYVPARSSCGFCGRRLVDTASTNFAHTLTRPHACAHRRTGAGQPHKAAHAGAGQAQRTLLPASACGGCLRLARLPIVSGFGAAARRGLGRSLAVNPRFPTWLCARAPSAPAPAPRAWAATGERLSASGLYLRMRRRIH